MLRGRARLHATDQAIRTFVNYSPARNVKAGNDGMTKMAKKPVRLFLLIFGSQANLYIFRIDVSLGH